MTENVDEPVEEAPVCAQPRSIGTRVRSVITAPATFGGLVVALTLGFASLQPTLMPRTGLVQGAISGICISLGYAIGSLAGRVLRYGLRQRGWRIPTTLWRPARVVLAVVTLVAFVAGLWLWLGWQNRQRDLLAMEHIGAGAFVPLVAVGALVGTVLGLAGRLVGAAVRKQYRWNQRHVPRPVAVALTVFVVFSLSVYVLRDVAFHRFTLWADSSFGAVDRTTPEDIVRPDSPTVSGSPTSLVEWSSLGFNGRAFASGSTPKSEMETYWGPDETFIDPVRAYVGKSALSMQERADLAVRELERAGGFERSVLVVATATGSGWIDPDSARALEMMYRGDCAIVSMQYSFLPSWISFVTDLDAASKAGVELFNAVHDRWLQLPENSRPKLIVFGLSLGSYGAEFAFSGVNPQVSVANMVSRTDGVLLVGPTNSNPVHQQLIADRDVGSTVWNPTYDKGREVQFITRDPANPPPNQPRTWPVVYLQHPSDPVTQWGFDWLWSPSAWNDRPRGYDVPNTGRWFPIATWTQGIFDLMAGFSAPPGFGHDYRLDYVEGWSRVVPPEGWSPERARSLEKFLTAG